MTLWKVIIKHFTQDRFESSECKIFKNEADLKQWKSDVMQSHYGSLILNFILAHPPIKYVEFRKGYKQNTEQAKVQRARSTDRPEVILILL